MASPSIFIVITIVLFLIVTEHFVSCNNDTCITPDGFLGNCVNIKNCPTLLKLLQPTSLTPQNRNFLLNSKCGEYVENPKVCCKHDYSDQNPTKIQAFSLTTNERLPNVNNHPNLRFLDQNNCGLLNTASTGSSTRNTNLVPWMALLKYKDSENFTRYLCDGQVISSLYIITKVACLADGIDNKLVGVRIGEDNDTINKDCAISNNCDKKFEDFGVDEVIPHPEYSKQLKQNDIALIRIDREIDFGSGNFRPICLPLNEAVTISKQNFMLTGYGQDFFDPTEDWIILKLNMTQYPQDQCTSRFSDSNSIKIWHKHICATGVPKSVRANSGSALQAQIYDNRGYRFVLYGILTFGGFGLPEVFTRVVYYVNWILDNMRYKDAVIHTENKPLEIQEPFTISDEQPPDVKGHPNLQSLNQIDCGLLDPANNTLSSNDEIIFKHVPWMALLKYSNTENGESPYLCDGTVISSLYIITAASCVTNLSNVTNHQLIGVRVGEYDDKIKKNCAVRNDCDKRFQDFGIVQVIPHPEYLKDTILRNDIALLKLDCKIDFKSGIFGPICLPLNVPTALPDKNFILTNHVYEIKNDWSTGDLVTAKRNVTLYPQDKCTSRIVTVSNRTKIWHKHICANNVQADFTGMAGGSLQAQTFYKGDTRFILRGILSFGQGYEGEPVAYTRVDYYVDWILDNMKNEDSVLMNQSIEHVKEKPPNVANHPNVNLVQHHSYGFDYGCEDTESWYTTLIAGGIETEVKEFPWMALLTYDVGQGKISFDCGGSVISDRYILTAAHCVTNLSANKRLFGIRLGEHDLSTVWDCSANDCNSKFEDYPIEEVIPHPEYNLETLYNDIALIRVGRRIDFLNSGLRPICLPTRPTSAKIPDKFVVAGWGLHDDRKEQSKVLRKAELPHYPLDQCISTYKKLNKTVWHKHICAGGERGVDVRKGDSGGPLQAHIYFTHRNRTIQYGIVSFGIGEGPDNKGYPSVYTRVDYYLEWILNHMRE